MFGQGKVYKDGRTLSEIASDVMREVRGQAEDERDIALFNAPRECLTLVWQSTERRIRAILDDAGLTAEEFCLEVEERTSSRYVYFGGFGMVNQMMVEAW